MTAGGVRVLTASAASPVVADGLSAMAAAMGPPGETPTVRDVVPQPPTDPHGAGFIALLLPLVAGAALPALAVGTIAPGRWLRAGAVGAYAVVCGLVLAGVLHGWFGTLTGSYVRDAGVLALAVAAGTMVLVGMQWVGGRTGLAVGALALLLVGNPLSGAATAPEFLASPWREIGQAMPPGAAVQALRSVSFFDGAAAVMPLAVLGAWTVVGLVLLGLPRRRVSPWTPG